jgi:acetylornithine deacetylase
LSESEMSVESTLKELVAIDSVSSHSNESMVDYLSNRLSAKGFHLQRDSYVDVAGVQKTNLIALSMAADTVELALVGHTDTVPYPSDWPDALSLTEKDGNLYGRGSCDTKGFIAAALTALDAIDLKQLSKPLALLFTADEEIGCFGAKHLASTNPFRVLRSIVGEPTSLRPMRAGKGYCIAEASVTGREGHSAYPAVGTSAIYGAARLIAEIERIAKELESDTHPDFDPPFTTLNVGLVRGGTAKNIIAGECAFTLEWRPVPGQRPELVLDKVQKAIEREKAKDAHFQAVVTPTRIDGGVETPADSQLVRFLESVTGNAAGTIAFGTEAPQMIEMGAHAVVIGPGDIRVAHRKGEYVPREELHRCVDVLKASIMEFCG